jgi:hypothetical protein
VAPAFSPRQAEACEEGRIGGLSPQQKSPEVFDLMANPVSAFLAVSLTGSV